MTTYMQVEVQEDTSDEENNFQSAENTSPEPEEPVNLSAKPKIKRRMVDTTITENKAGCQKM